MFLKPKECEGCPFQHLSKYITPDYIVPTATVGILAQAPGSHEEQGLKIEGKKWSNGKLVDITSTVRPQPLIGRTGNFTKNEFWGLTKLKWEEVSKFNVIKCRPYGSNDLPDIGGNKSVKGLTVTMLKQAIAHCKAKYLRIPETTKYLMAMGEVSLYALSGEELLNYRKHQEIEVDYEIKEKKSTITEWRGWALEYDRAVQGITAGLHDYYNPLNNSNAAKLVVFPVVHIASLFENNKLFHATLSDFNRFGKLIRGEWPKPLPEIKINHIPTTIPGIVGFDTEYTRDNQLIMWSMADAKSNIYVVDSQYSRRFTTLPSSLVVVTQNGLVDIPHLIPLLSKGFKFRLEDCMIAHALIWAGEPTNLDYQLSKVGDYNRHKHLLVNIFSSNKDLGYFYAGLDAHTTLNNAWRHLALEMSKDTLVKAEYELRRRPLLPIIHKFQQRGVLLDQQRLQLISQIYGEKLLSIQKRAQEITNNSEFNIKSNIDCSRAIYEGRFEKDITKASIPKIKKIRTTSRITQKIEQLQLLLKGLENEKGIDDS